MDAMNLRGIVVSLRCQLFGLILRRALSFAFARRPRNAWRTILILHLLAVGLIIGPDRTGRIASARIGDWEGQSNLI
jgi:hypothetical protein